MKRYLKHFIIWIVVLALFVPAGVVLAQDELTLESLAEQVAGVVEQVADLAERVAAIEDIWTGLGPIILEDGNCVIGLNDTLQDETVIKFKDTYDEWLDVEDVSIVQVMYLPGTGNIAVIYEEFWDDRYVIESWNSCEFLGSTAWWEED